MGWGTLKSEAALVSFGRETHIVGPMREITCPEEDCSWRRALPRAGRNALAATSFLRKELRVHLQENHNYDGGRVDGK